jgi:hypothetical protein
VFQNGRHISAPFGVVEIFFELPCLFYKHLAQKDVYVVRTLTLLFACRLCYVIPVSTLSNSLLSDSIYRHNRRLYRVYHEPSVKTVQHQVMLLYDNYIFKAYATEAVYTQRRVFVKRFGLSSSRV